MLGNIYLGAADGLYALRMILGFFVGRLFTHVLGHLSRAFRHQEGTDDFTCICGATIQSLALSVGEASPMRQELPEMKIRYTGRTGYISITLRYKEADKGRDKSKTREAAGHVEENQKLAES